MKKLHSVFEKIKDWNKKLGKNAELLTLIEIPLIMLVVILTLNFLFTYSNNRFSSAKVLNTWDYIYSNKAEEDFHGNLNSATPLSPIPKEKIGKYLHMRSNISASDKERTLVINTDYAPVKVVINGETVYDNHYSDCQYVGNAYNAVTIPASVSDVSVAISVRLPFSADVTVSIGKNTSHPGFVLGGGMVFCFALIVISVAFFAVFIYLRYIKHRSTKFFLTAVLSLFYAVTVLIVALTRYTYFINIPLFYNVSVSVENLLVILFSVVAINVLAVNNKRINVLLLLSTFLIVATCFVNQPALLRALHFVSSAFCIGTLVLLLIENHKMFNRRIQYAKSIFSMLVFLLMSNLLGTAMFQILKFRSGFAFCKLIGGFVFLCFMLFILIVKEFSYQSDDVQEKIEHYRICVNKVADLMRGIAQMHSETEVYKALADGLCDLCEHMSKQFEDEDFSFVIAKKDGEKYNEIYSKDTIGSVNYRVIETRCNTEQNNCLFCETYFDLVFFKQDDLYSILHFENITDGLDSFFISVITTLYSCAILVLARFSDTDDYDNLEKDIFTNLAQKTEISAGNNPDHLASVEYITKTLLETLDYPEDVCDTVSKASMLHDIGKIAIPFEITTKAGLLSESERKIINMHTDFGYTILSVFDSDFLKQAALIAKDHHERYDGTGNNKIKGEDINRFARVVSVADCIDALTSKRSYKEAWAFDAVMFYVDQQSGTMFDPEIIAALHECEDKVRKHVEEKDQ